MRRRSVPGIVVLVMVVLGVGVWAVAIESPIFTVRRLHLEGNVRLSHEDVVELTGSIAGRNLLTLPLRDLEERLLGSPWVADARAGRALPSTVVLRIRERRSAAWVTDGTSGAVVAADGTVLQHRARRPGGLVTLGRVRSLPEPGARLPESSDALRVVASLPEPVAREVVRATSRSGSVQLVLREGGRVLYGDADSAEAKNATLLSMLEWVGDQGVGVDYIDLRAPASPALKPTSS